MATMLPTGGRALACTLVLLLCSPRPSAGQQAGERIYSQIADSVVMLEITSDSGERVGSASGFLVGADQVVTNAHVVKGGTINVIMGSLHVPCKTARTDVLNDLALCSLAARSAAPAITLAAADPKPGSVVYVISNPRGFERTISQGLVTGARELDGRNVVQVSAAISQGSSGGPLLNEDGELIGVAVAIRPDGQNLNFAVPLATVRDFLSNRTTAATASDLLAAARRLRTERYAFSETPESAYQKNEHQIRDLLSQAIDQTQNVEILKGVYDAGLGYAAVQVTAARKIISLSTTPAATALADLGRALYYQGSPESLAEAERVVSRATGVPGASATDIILLGEIQSAAEKPQSAYQTFLKAASAAEPRSDMAAAAHWNLFASASALGRAADADNWFGKIKNDATPLQWFFYGQHLDDLKRYAEAGDAYAQSFRLAPKVSSYACEAGQAYYSGDKLDESLQFLRQCIDLASLEDGQEARIERAHQRLAAILNRRGVYDEAINHARQAIALDLSDAWAFHYLAKAFEGQRRFTEAIAAAKNALRLSDGKFSSMHFALGSAYFELRQWPEAAQAFVKAAELSPRDPAPALNVAVSLYNDRFYSQSLNWYQEVLKRDPNYRDKAEVVRTIGELQRRR